MKAVTRKMIDAKMVGRAILDRKRTVTTSVLVDQRAIDKEFGSRLSPSMLYSYYISICQVSNYDLMADDKVAKQLGSTTRSVAEARRNLTKAGWIKFDRFTHKGVEYGIWYIGKDVVQANITTDTSLEELNRLGIVTDEEYQTLRS